MLSPLAGLPLHLFRLRPPYSRFYEFNVLLERPNGSLEPGTLIGIHAGAFSRDWAAVQTWVPRIRSHFPSAPVVLHIDTQDTARAVHCARLSAFLYVRAILVDGEPIAETLRQIIPRPVNLAADVTEWLRIRGVRLPPECLYLVGEVIRLAAHHHTVGELLASVGESERNVRKRFHSRGVVPPGHWFAAARAVHAALRLQHDPGKALLEAAWESGYSDHSAMSRQMVRLFGLRPSVVRSILGWEPLLDRWLTREEGIRSSMVAAVCLKWPELDRSAHRRHP